MLCEACGTENRAGSRFCDHCGSPLSLSCPACGEPNRADALFCAACGAGLATDAPRATPQPSAERRQVSVLFADLVGFTTFAEGRDPERVRAVQQQYFDAATDAITRHGGTVEKFVGDAVMAVWGTPIAHEDDAQRAVRAGLEIVKAVEGLGHELKARAGVVTGEAAVTIGAANQGMVAGDMVNTAARLQAGADPGHVLADHATVQAAQDTITFERIGDVELKGKAGPVRAWRALRVQPTGGTDVLAPPFVGRVDELRRLKDLLHAPGRDRRSRLVSITGPAGIGKSRLVDELRAYAEGVAELFPWHTGRSPSYGEGLAFWALGEMVRRRAGLAEGDDEETTRGGISATLDEFVQSAEEREWIEPALLALLGIGDAKGSESLFPAWRTFFERIAERGTVVLVFEDLQWADRGTVEFIQHLMDWSRNQPILVVTVARPELLDSQPGWGTARSNSTAIALEPMPDSDIRALLVAVLPGLSEEHVSAIVARAEGMPLYAVEMVRALMADGRIERRGDVYVPTSALDAVPIPASLRSLIASRLDALSAADRALLQHAAVLGLAFAAEAVASVTGLPQDEVQPRLLGLVRRELLEIEVDPRSPERGQYRFVQSLIREVAYETLSLRDRRSRHLAAARYLEAGESDEAAGALASHYLAAYHASDTGPEADAVAAQARVSLRAAGERAAALGAHAQAVENFEHALTITHDPGERAELLEQAATSAVHAVQPKAADLAREAVDTYRALGERARTRRAIAHLGDILLDLGRVPEAAEALRAATAEIDGEPQEGWGEPEAMLFAMLSRAEMRLDRNDEAVTAADRALVTAERLKLDYVITTALLNKGSALGQAGRNRESTALLQGAVALAERGGWQHLELRARMNNSNMLWEDDPLGGLESLEATADIAQRVGDLAMYAYAVTLYATGAIPVGRPETWARALELIAVAMPLAAPSDRVSLVISRLIVDRARGADVAAEIVEVEKHVAESQDPRARSGAEIARAWASFVDGRWADALRATVAAMDTDEFAVLFVGVIAGLSAWHARDVGVARRALEAAERMPFGGLVAVATRKRLSAFVAAIDGRQEDARRDFADSLARYHEAGVRFEWALAVVDALTVVGPSGELRRLADEARSVLSELGAESLAARLDAVLAGDGPVASPTTSTTPSGLGAST